MGERAKGMLCIIASAFGFALMAMFVRLCDDFGGPVSSFQKSFFRNAIALVIAAVVFARHGRGAMPGARAWLPLVLRSTLGSVGIFANFYALGRIPIGEAMTLNKTAPFFTVLFAWLFLGERANLRQFRALAFAFFGVALVMRPGVAFGGCEGGVPPAVWGLLSGICAGGAYACVRKLGLMRVDGAFVVLFFSAFSCLCSVPFMAARFDPMTARQLLTLLGAGAGAAIGQFGITAAYRHAAPRSIALFDYSNILFTAAFGYLFFEQVPDRLAVLGFVVILYAAFRLRSGEPADARPGAEAVPERYAIDFAAVRAELRRGNRVLLLVRHSERPRIDHEDPTFGASLPLTAHGVEMSEDFGRALAGASDDVQFLASPLRRTVMTAERIAAGMGLADAAIPEDDLIGNGSPFIADRVVVWQLFRDGGFFAKMDGYLRTGTLEGFGSLVPAAAEYEEYVLSRFTGKLGIFTTHDVYVAAYLQAKGVKTDWCAANWPRFLDAAAIIVEPTGRRRYALLRAGLSSLAVGVGSGERTKSTQ